MIEYIHFIETESQLKDVKIFLKILQGNEEIKNNMDNLKVKDNISIDFKDKKDLDKFMDKMKNKDQMEYY